MNQYKPPTFCEEEICAHSHPWEVSDGGTEEDHPFFSEMLGKKRYYDGNTKWCKISTYVLCGVDLVFLAFVGELNAQQAHCHRFGPASTINASTQQRTS